MSGRTLVQAVKKVLNFWIVAAALGMIPLHLLRMIPDRLGWLTVVLAALTCLIASVVAWMETEWWFSRTGERQPQVRGRTTA